MTDRVSQVTMSHYRSPTYGAYSIPVSRSGTDAYSSQLGAYGV